MDPSASVAGRARAIQLVTLDPPAIVGLVVVVLEVQLAIHQRYN